MSRYILKHKTNRFIDGNLANKALRSYSIQRGFHKARHEVTLSLVKWIFKKNGYSQLSRGLFITEVTE